MKIVLAGATGFVGRRTLGTLAASDAEVVVMVRHPEKVPERIRAEARIEHGDLGDAAFVARATHSADALLWMTPSSFVTEDLRAYTLGLAENAAQAIRTNAIERVVFVSSHGADHPGRGHVSLAGEVEKRLAASAPNLTVLRSAGFMENHLNGLDGLREGVLVNVLPPAKKYPLVATRDVGDAAATCLLDTAWIGHRVRGVHGPEDLSIDDQVAILGRVLGRPIRYRQIPPKGLRDAMLARGASASVAEGFFDFYSAFAQPEYRPTEARTAGITTPTTFETFVREVIAPRLA